MQLFLYREELRFKYPVHTAHGQFNERPTLIIELRDGDTSFWSEAPGFVDDAYMPETHDALTQRWMDSADTVLAAFKEERVPEYMAFIQNEPIFRYSVDVLYAQWLAKQQNRTLFQYMACKHRNIDGTAMVGMLNSGAEYQNRILEVLQCGYSAIKLKLSPESLPLICDVIRLNQDSLDYICVDANASFNPDNMMDLRALPESVTIEQPLHPDQHQSFLQLIHQLPHQFLVDESVRNIADIDSFNGLGVGVMLKPVCMGGIHSTMNAIQRCRERFIPCGISGYMDSGVGRYVQWCFAQMPNVLLRPDFVWSDYYFKNDVVTIGSDTSDNAMPPATVSAPPIIAVG